MAETTKPLAGLKVVELGTLIAGPFCTRILAEFGAEVIKVESPDGGDPLRKWRKLYEGTSLWWYVQARNKQSIALNLKDPRARDIARKLALDADAVLAPHHGGRGASGAAFVAAVAPAHTLVSAGYRNPFGHPHREALARYAASQVWRTDHDGALRLRLADAASVSAWRQTRARYWHGR